MNAFADLPFTIPLELVDDFLGKLHYVSEAMSEFELAPETRNRVRFTLAPGAEAEAPAIAAHIAEVARKMCDAYRPGEKKVLIARTGAGTHAADPHPLLEARGELYHYGAGRYGLGPALLALADYFDRRLMRVIKGFAAEPRQFPSLIGADVLERCKYLRSFPHALTLVAHLREDLGAIRHFARTARWDGSRLTCAAEDLGPVECLLAPAVCFHCYAWLQDTRQTAPRTFTALGRCFRYESGNLGGLERLWDFTMRELIFVGPREFVLTERQRAIDAFVPLLDEWGLAYEISSATDPFFIEDYATAAAFQRAFDLKFEVRAALPYKQKTLAVGSFNFHQDYFGHSLKIHAENGEPVSTGCVGFGLERLILAFLAQHGLEREQWPVAVAREIEI